MIEIEKASGNGSMDMIKNESKELIKSILGANAHTTDWIFLYEEEDDPLHLRAYVS